MSNPSDPYNRPSDPQQPQQNPPPRAPQPPQQPGYGYQPAPGYNAPPPGYNAPPPGYGAPQQNPPGYGGPSSPGNPIQNPQPGYGTPQPGMPGYGGPPPGYGNQQAAPGYGFPPAGYGARPPYASWLQRVGGALIDGLIVGVVPGILYVLGISVGIQSATCVPDSNGYPVCSGGGLSAVGLVLIFLAVIVGIAAQLYLLHQVGTTGQTPGKRVVGIRLIREADGQVIGFGNAFVRGLCHALDSLCYIGYLWPIWDEKRQTFADKIMSTIVVQA